MIIEFILKELKVVIILFGDYGSDPEFAETSKWATDDYLEVVKVFRAFLSRGMKVPYDDVAVIASQQTNTSWIFTTIYAPATNNHAVSGNRPFGFTSNEDGTYTIFTRGADVATGYIDVMAGE